MKLRRDRFPLIPSLLLGLGLAAVLMGGYLAGRLGTPGKLADPDAYMWLHQVQRWHDGAGWYDEASPRSNAPEGETLHWARPFALVLALPAWALSPALGFSRALFAWGVVCGPVLLVATVVLYAWAVRPLLDRFERLLACGLFLANPAIVTNFYPADPDHKCLHALLFTALLGLSIRLLADPWRRRDAILFAGLGVFGLWSSIEMLFPIVALESVLALQWIRRGPEIARLGVFLSNGLVLFGLVALALHLPPASWRRHLEVDSYSLFYFVFLLLLAAAWNLANRLGARLQPGDRLTATLAGVFFIAAAMGLLHPGCWRGPFADVDPQVEAIWRDHVQNGAPVLQGEPRLALEGALFFLGMPLMALPLALTLSRQARSGRRAAWMLISGGLVACLGVALFVADRWSSQASIYAVAPLAIALTRLVPNRCLGAAWRLLLLMLLGNAGIVFASIIAGMPSAPARPAPDTLISSPVKGMEELPTIQLADYLNGPAFPAPPRLFTDIDLAPELLYRTRVEVVATPYHRNAAGILDDYRLMHAHDDAAAQAIVARRGVTYILVCPTLDVAQNYYGPHARGTLYQELVEGHPPSWLRAVNLPPDLAGDFKLYAVAR